MLDADDEIREIKKEIIESRGLAIRTNNLVNSLAADVKSIAKRQAGYEKSLNWNSAVFLVTVAAISFGGLKLASDAKLSEIQSEMTHLRGQVRTLEEQLSEETAKGEERARAEALAARFYELIRNQQRHEVVEQYDALAAQRLSPAETAFFRDAYDRFQLDLSITSYQAGLELIRNGRYAEAAEKFQESMRLREESAHIPSVRYHLARTMRHLGRQSEAMVFLRQVTEQETDRELQDDALWLLAQCQKEAGDIDGAKDSVGELLRRFPRSTLVRDARLELRDLLRRSVQGPTPTP